MLQSKIKYILTTTFIIITNTLFFNVCNADGPSSVYFFAASDPQFYFYDQSVADRASATFTYLNTIIKKCSNCSQILTVSGDLTEEDSSPNPITASAEVRQQLSSNGIAELEVQGNHDITDFSNKLDGFSAFNPPIFYPYSPVLKLADLYLYGWDLLNSDYLTDCTDYRRTPYSCTNAIRYATYRIAPPRTAISTPDTGIAGLPQTSSPGAYIVALHNELGSDSSVQYLQKVLSLVNNGLIEKDKPIILVAHKADNTDRQDLQNLISQLNVAVIIGGHYHCANTNGEHCDLKSTDTIWNTSLINNNGVLIKFVNTSAVYQNIFWTVAIDAGAARTVHLTRFNRANLKNPNNIKPGPLWEVTQSMIGDSKTLGSLDNGDSLGTTSFSY